MIHTEPVLVMLKKKCLNVPRYFYFLREATVPLNDSKGNKSNHFTFGCRLVDFYFSLRHIYKQVFHSSIHDDPLIVDYVLEQMEHKINNNLSKSNLSALTFVAGRNHCQLSCL